MSSPALPNLAVGLSSMLATLLSKNETPYPPLVPPRMPRPIPPLKEQWSYHHRNADGCLKVGCVAAIEVNSSFYQLVNPANALHALAIDRVRATSGDQSVVFKNRRLFLKPFCIEQGTCHPSPAVSRILREIRQLSFNSCQLLSVGINLFPFREPALDKFDDSEVNITC